MQYSSNDKTNAINYIAVIRQYKQMRIKKWCNIKVIRWMKKNNESDKMTYMKVYDMVHCSELVLKNGRFINGNDASKILKKNCKSTNERKKK